MEADVQSMARRRRQAAKRRRPTIFSIPAPYPTGVPVVVRPVQTVQHPTVDLTPIISGVAEIFGEAYSPEWKQEAPVSHTIFQGCQRAMQSQDLSDEAKRGVELIRTLSVIYWQLTKERDN